MSNQQNDIYLENLEDDLYRVLKSTREHPGLSILDISVIVKSIFGKEEIEYLIKELQNQ